SSPSTTPTCRPRRSSTAGSRHPFRSDPRAAALSDQRRHDMGFFKDAKDGIKGAKELGDYHGGMPSMRGAFKDLAALSSDQGQGEILKNGVATKARVLSFAMPHPTEKFTMQIDLEITPPEGGDPYKVTYLYPTAR